MNGLDATFMDEFILLVLSAGKKVCQSEERFKLLEIIRLGFPAVLCDINFNNRWPFGFFVALLANKQKGANSGQPKRIAEQ